MKPQSFSLCQANIDYIEDQFRGSGKRNKSHWMDDLITAMREKSEPKRKTEVTKKFKFNDEDLRFAKEMFDRVKIVNPLAKANLESWANTIRLMREVNNLSHKEMWITFDWANKDSFWCSNILSPDKLRKQFDKLTVKINETTRPTNKPDYSDGLSDSQRAMLQARKERDAAQQNNGSILGENGRALLR